MTRAGLGDCCMDEGTGNELALLLTVMCWFFWAVGVALGGQTATASVDNDADAEAGKMKNVLI